MKRWMLLLLVVLLGGCAAVGRAPPPGAEIFRDEHFGRMPTPDLQELFALTPEMRRYLDERIQPQVRRKGPQRALLDALYTDGELRLEYDATHTRSVGEAFAARRGNCLSLVVMTAAFAQELGLQLRYQEVLGAPAVEHDGDLTFLVGHVNLAMGSGTWSMRQVENGSHWLVVDFLPGQDLQRQRTQALEERRIRAMFMNNRAAEEMARGRLDQAYGWLRAAYAQDATLPNLYNTLGVLYRRRGLTADAEHALRVALAMEPTHEAATGNLAAVLRESGRGDAAETVARGRAVPQPGARYSQARQALADGQLKQALRLLQGELGLTPRNPELHYWLAMTWAQAGDAARSRAHLELAAEYSAAGEQKALYTGKLARLKAPAAAAPTP